ncbi:MAG: hypothetical protein RLZZ126_595 [Pseudomonadota bacterium]|jgi:hypothetical protein
MLLKTADDKSKRLKLLEDLQQSQILDARQKDWLQQEMDRLRKGIQGERDAAHYLDNYLADGKNSVLMHDFRFVFEGETAQIDHLLINRLGDIFLFETKNFSGNLRITELGEFSVGYGRREFGIPSPLEQSRRHERVLTKLLAHLEIVPRVGSQFVFHHIVLVDPKATITRPSQKALDTSMVIKADQFPDWHKKFADQDIGVVDVFRGLANLRNADTVREWGEQLLRQHRPADLLNLPDFMAPKLEVPTPTGQKSVEPQNPAVPRAAPKTLACAHCGNKITFPEGKFCWNNERRFGGLQYCRGHQNLFK